MNQAERRRQQKKVKREKRNRGAKKQAPELKAWKPPKPLDPPMNSYEQAVQWPDPILTVMCPLVGPEMFEQTVFKVTAAKLKMLVEHDGNSLGMAAPQVGSKLRMMALKTFNGTHILVNPEIAKTRGTHVGPEGCFSLPGIRVPEVERHAQVWINALDVHGHPVSAHFTAMIAVAFQHELDHLDGKTILMHGEAETWAA